MNGSSRVNVDVLFRPRPYGRDVAQVFAVGVESTYAHLLEPQVRIVGPEEREGDFAQLF
jgi:hypothetical protein